MKNKHRARRLALQCLSCLDAQGLTPSTRKLVESFISDSRENEDVLSLAKKFLDGSLEYRDQCDEFLARHAKHWSLERLALVDRNILRLAAYELLCNQAPHKVVITEAIGLAKEFSSAESSRFVNGVLDAITREIHEEIADIEQ